MDEAIALTRELLAENYLEGHGERDRALDGLESLLQLHSELTGNQGDLDEIEMLKDRREKEVCHYYSSITVAFNAHCYVSSAVYRLRHLISGPALQYNAP
jgi:hypothetical protein